MSARPAADQFSELLHLTAHTWRTSLDRRLRRLGLSRATWMLLALVGKHDGLNQSELADRLGLEAASVVRLVDRLEKDGLIERRPGSDRRVRTVHLTARGQAVSDPIREGADALRRELFDGIPAAELSAGIALLAKVRARLEAMQ